MGYTVRELVGPGRAEALLQLNTANRPPKPMKIGAFAQDMAAGYWRDTGIPILIWERPDGSRVLEDGQNRLKAIIQAGVTIPLHVHYNPHSVFDVVDTGAPRSLRDLVAIAMPGYRAHFMGAAVNAVAVADFLGPIGDAKRFQAMRFAQRLQHAQAHEDDTIFAYTLRTHINDRTKKFGRISVRVGTLAGAIAALRVNPRHLVSDFIERAALREELRRGTPDYVLMRELDNAYSEKEDTGTYSLLADYRRFLRIWNAHVRGETMTIARKGTISPKPLSFSDAYHAIAAD
jgi:hypothetical protein